MGADVLGELALAGPEAGKTFPIILWFSEFFPALVKGVPFVLMARRVISTLLCAFFVFMKLSIRIHTQTCIYIVFVKITTEPEICFCFVCRSVELYLFYIIVLYFAVCSF